MKTFKEIWPLTVIADRYQGTYSRGKYLAFNLAHDEIPEHIHGCDGEEMEFWESELECKYIIGKGDTPQEAINDLGNKLMRATRIERLVLKPEKLCQYPMTPDEAFEK